MTSLRYEGVGEKNGIRINANENNFNPFKENIKDIILKISEIDLNRYPDNNYEALREAYSNYINLANIQKENIICGNGSDEMINLIISKYINKKDSVVTLDPDFSMFKFYTTVNEGNLYGFKFNLDKFNVENFIDFAREKKGKVIIFSNPNNPTGKVIKKDDIKIILNTFKDSIVVIDEAYYEFYGESVCSLINDYENLIITRTLSKAWSMAALRVGFLIANKKIINSLLDYKVPYNINSISGFLAKELLYYREDMEKSLKNIIEEREFLYKNLKRLENNYNMRFYKSKGNFIYGTGQGKDFYKVLKENEIYIRSFENGSVRISVGNREENRKLISILDKLK
ncbi:MAG: histidinol-phosphate transaminase [Clostridium perfringens]|nr:histidinol-phosphate transaminase [Clostridium perfringens]